MIMVIIEMREAAYDGMFDLLDEAIHNAKKTKMSLCDLEDAMYECYESLKDDPEYDDREEFEIPTSDEEDEYELNLRSGMRRSGSRKTMRMRYNKSDEGDGMSNYRRSMRRRRSRRSDRYTY